MVDWKPDVGNFPLDVYANVAQRKAQLEQQAQAQNFDQLTKTGELIRQVGQSLHEQRSKTAQALAAARLIASTPEGKTLLGTNQVASEAGRPVTQNQTAAFNPDTGSVTPNTSPFTEKTLATAIEGITPKETLQYAIPQLQDLLSVNALSGEVQNLGKIRKGTRTVPVPKANPQQSQLVDTDGTPLIFDPVTRSYKRAEIQPGVKPVPTKGTGDAVNQAAVAQNLLPQVDQLYDAIGKLAPVQQRIAATGVGSVAYPEINQTMSNLKREGFVVGGKQLTGTELKVVSDAFFPSWKDTPESREQKREALKQALTGQLSYLEAARLLGPAGAKAKEVLQQYPNSKPKAAPAVSVPPPAAPPPPSDLVHLSTKELQDLRKKMTEHQQNGPKP